MPIIAVAAASSLSFAYTVLIYPARVRIMQHTFALFRLSTSICLHMVVLVVDSRLGCSNAINLMRNLVRGRARRAHGEVGYAGGTPIELE